MKHHDPGDIATLESIILFPINLKYQLKFTISHWYSAINLWNKSLKTLKDLKCTCTFQCKLFTNGQNEIQIVNSNCYLLQNMSLFSAYSICNKKSTGIVFRLLWINFRLNWSGLFLNNKIACVYCSLFLACRSQCATF